MTLPTSITGDDILKAAGKTIEEMDASDECVACWAHEQANKMLGPDTLSCPKCGHPLSLSQALSGEVVTVGEHNATDIRGSVYRRMSVGSCPQCEFNWAPYAVQISYNANHDIHYTGGGRYLIGSSLADDIQKVIRPELKQWIDRIKKGEDPERMSIDSWIAAAIQNFVSAELKKHRLKL